MLLTEPTFAAFDKAEPRQDNQTGTRILTDCVALLAPSVPSAEDSVPLRGCAVAQAAAVAPFQSSLPHINYQCLFPSFSTLLSNTRPM